MVFAFLIDLVIDAPFDDRGGQRVRLLGLSG